MIFSEKECDHGETSNTVRGGNAFYWRPFDGRAKCGAGRNVVWNYYE
jgi:hypothetical protein